MYDAIHDDFPKDKLVRIMRPFLYLYLTLNHGIEDTLMSEYAENLLTRKMKLFTEYNPLFGRMFIKNKMVGGRRVVETTFNDVHLDFDEL